MKREIQVKYLETGLTPIEKISKGDWIDLRAAEDIDIRAGEFALIPLGVAMSLPWGYEAIVAPRSSTYKTWGIIQANSLGIIDESYCGDTDQWFFPAIAMRDTEICKNDRICQFRIIKHQPTLLLKTVTAMRHKNRGGVGSTGKM